MEQVYHIFTIVAQVIIVCGGITFLICFAFGAALLWQMFKLALYTSKLVNKWSQYKRLPVEAREEAEKSGYFNDDTKDIK